MVDISLEHSRSAVIRRPRVSARRAEALFAAAKRLDTMLKDSNQSLRVSLGDWNTVLGIAASSRDLPELTFDRYDECQRAMQNCRLYNFAIPFFSGRMRVSGSLNALIDVLYVINISNDVAQSIQEQLLFAVFRKLKEWAPWFAYKFESNFHYSLDVRAYELFLDPYLQYTCGRVGPSTRSIDEAQVEKFKLIADWVGQCLGPIRGKRHLDIGCGWGGLVRYFRTVYECNSVGITNCVAQREYMANQLRLQPIFGDFTCVGEMINEFDFVTVIGMSEHVVGGLKDTLLEVIRSALKDNGVLYFQTIAKPDQWIGGDAYRIAQEVVFPGHDLDRQNETELRFVRTGFKIIHAEDHTPDYAYTTCEWAQRVEENFERLKELIGPKNASLFLMYLLYASKLFKMRRGKLMRYALVKA